MRAFKVLLAIVLFGLCTCGPVEKKASLSQLAAKAEGMGRPRYGKRYDWQLPETLDHIDVLSDVGKRMDWADPELYDQLQDLENVGKRWDHSSIANLQAALDQAGRPRFG